MHYLLLINSFITFILCGSYILVGHQLQGNGFVDVLPMKKWHISPGEKKNLEIEFNIKEGYHIQADHVLDENLIPTSLSLTSPDEILVYDPVFPDPIPFHLKNVEDTMEVFHQQLKISLPVVIKENTNEGIYTVHGNLYYQACDSVKCYFPRDLPFEIRIWVR